MNSHDPLESAAKGATKAVIELSAEKIKEYVHRFRNKELVFIEDNETINLVKEIRDKSEWDIFDQYLKDKDLRLIVQMGITLRKLETNTEQLQNLRKKIQMKFGTDGLHLAQFVQNKILSKFLTSLIDEGWQKSDIIKTLNETLNNINKYSIFVKNSDDVDKMADIILQKIKIISPDILMVFGSGFATEKVEAIVEKIKDDCEYYTINTYKERQEEEGFKKITVFIISKKNEALSDDSYFT